MKMSIGKKIGSGFAIMVLLIISLGITCFFSLQVAKVKITEIKEASQRSDLATTSALASRSFVSAMRGIFAYGDEKYYQQAGVELDNMLTAQNQLLALTPVEEKVNVQKLLEATTKNKEITLNETFPTVRAMARETAAGNVSAAQVYRDKLNMINLSQLPNNTEIIKLMDAIKVYNDEQVQKSTNAAVGEADKVIMTALGFSLIAALLGITLGIITTKMITKPLTAMVLACEAFAAGDFRDKPRKFAREDEIGQLGDALANMRDNLRFAFKQVNESAEHVAASSEQLTASAEQSAQAANQVAESICQVATGAEQQVHVINETSSVVDKMTAGMQQVTSTTNLAAEKSVLAAVKAKEGGMSVENAVTQMSRIEQTVNNSAQVVTTLGTRSKEIGEIVDTISGIAGQTNLLALNAAIEAARAGEQGRGFAVVAEEVRKLAEQSQEAAKKIGLLIGEIQGETDKAVIAMSEGTREVKIGTEVVTNAGRSFREIAVLVTEVSTQVKDISASIQRMESGSQQIVSSVKEIDGLSKKASSEAQTVSAATEEQSASMEEIASSSQALAHLAMDLREAVNKFQI